METEQIVAVLFLDHWKAELQNIQYSNVFCIPMFGIQAPTVFMKISQTPWRFSMDPKESTDPWEGITTLN